MGYGLTIENGAISVYFMKRRSIVVADDYCKPLTKLRRAIENRQLGVIVRHDSTRPPLTKKKIQDYHWEHFEHPPYSSHLAPSDYFLGFKSITWWQRFENDEEL